MSSGRRWNSEARGQRTRRRLDYRKSPLSRPSGMLRAFFLTPYVLITAAKKWFFPYGRQKNLFRCLIKASIRPQLLSTRVPDV